MSTALDYDGVEKNPKQMVIVKVQSVVINWRLEMHLHHK